MGLRMLCGSKVRSHWCICLSIGFDKHCSAVQTTSASGRQHLHKTACTQDIACEHRGSKASTRSTDPSRLKLGNSCCHVIGCKGDNLTSVKGQPADVMHLVWQPKIIREALALEKSRCCLRVCLQSINSLH
jgi:hypothetical protein